MKKFRIGILLAVACLFLSACGCTKEDFKVTFDSNGGSTVSSQTIEKGGKVTRPTDPTRDGYTFDGWYLTLDDLNPYDFNTEVTKSFTLKAKWTEKTNGEEDNVCTLTCEEGYELIDGDSKNCSCKKKEETKPSSQTTTKPSKPTTPTKVDVTGVSFNDGSGVSLDFGSSKNLGVTVSPSNASNKGVTFTSSDTGVVTVDTNGNIKAVGSGTATITVTTTDGSKTATITVTVNDIYTYSTEQLDQAGQSFKVYIYKNGSLTSGIEAVYNASGTYLGQYEADKGAIMVSNTQVGSIAKIKVNREFVNITKR